MRIRTRRSVRRQYSRRWRNSKTLPPNRLMRRPDPSSSVALPSTGCWLVTNRIWKPPLCFQKRAGGSAAPTAKLRSRKIIQEAIRGVLSFSPAPLRRRSPPLIALDCFQAGVSKLAYKTIRARVKAVNPNSWSALARARGRPLKNSAQFGGKCRPSIRRNWCRSIILWSK